MKKSISGILITAALLQSAAYAADIKTVRSIADGSYSFSVEAETNTAVTIDIYAPGKTYKDMLSASDPLDVLKYHNEAYAGEDGTCTLRARLAGESGVYNANVVVGGEKNEIKLEFINAAANKTAIEGLNAASDIQAYIEENKADLGFFSELYDNVDKDAVCTMIKKYLPLDSSKPQEAIDIFNKAVTARAITEKDISKISDNKENISNLNDDSKTAEWYTKADEAGVDSRIEGKTFSSVEAFESAINEAIVLEVIKNPNGYENVKSIINDFKTEIGISSPTSSTAVYQKLAGKSYSDYAALKSAYNAAVKENSNSGSSSSGSSGGSSGGGSKFPSKVTTGEGLAFQPNLDPQPIEKEYFSDMENAAWAKPAVSYLAEKKIISGKSENEFCPSDNVFREEFVTMIVKAFEFEKFAEENRFEDVTTDKWFAEYVTAANQNGIVSGLTEEVFGAGEKITRQDMAAILYRVIEKKNIELKSVNEEVQFTDEAEIADYAKEAVSYLQTRGVISGMEDGGFKPGEYASRAQAAQMIYKILSSN